MCHCTISKWEIWCLYHNSETPRGKNGLLGSKRKFNFGNFHDWWFLIPALTSLRYRTESIFNWFRELIKQNSEKLLDRMFSVTLELFDHILLPPKDQGFFSKYRVFRACLFLFISPCQTGQSSIGSYWKWKASLD